MIGWLNKGGAFRRSSACIVASNRDILLNSCRPAKNSKSAITKSTWLPMSSPSNEAVVDNQGLAANAMGIEAPTHSFGSVRYAVVKEEAHRFTGICIEADVL